MTVSRLLSTDEKPHSVSVKMRSLLMAAGYLPLITCTRVSDGLDEIERLRARGFHTVEIALRTPLAFDLLAELERRHPDLVYGVGTVISSQQLKKSIDYGCHFAVSPGLSGDIVKVAQKASLALLPGVFTPTEVMKALGYGLNCLKFFPSYTNTVSYLDHLKALSSVFVDCVFCPSGGITLDNAQRFWALDSVIALGMSAGKLQDVQRRDLSLKHRLKTDRDLFSDH